MGTMNNLGITATNSAMISAFGKNIDLLQSKIGNWDRDNHCKFYYNAGAGGSVLQVMAKTVVGGAVGSLKDIADNHFNLLTGGKKKTVEHSRAWIDSELKKQKFEEEKYGKISVIDEESGNDAVVYALDDWGGIATEALMLAIETENTVKISQTFPEYKLEDKKDKKGRVVKDDAGNPIKVHSVTATTATPNKVTTKSLVWYDTTALITINSDKNLIATRVQGRDYSRKELVSNGDIKFSVSGQITSGRPDIYPTEEIKKFIKVMQYKGIVRVNNQILDQFGISHIVIENFSITPKEGYKSLQSYSFSAIGLQPEMEIAIKDDTVEILTPEAMVPEDDDSEWLKMLKNQLDGLKSMAGDLFSQGTGLATGMLDSVL